MPTLELFNQIGLSEAETIAWRYREDMRHQPNVYGQVWEWFSEHFYAYLAVLIGATLFGLLTSSERDLGRSIHGLVMAALVFAATAAVWYFRAMPMWHGPKELSLDTLPNTEGFRDLRKDPNLSLWIQSLKFTGDLDEYELAHIMWLVTQSPDGTEVRRGVVWSSLDVVPEVEVEPALY